MSTAYVWSGQHVGQTEAVTVTSADGSASADVTFTAAAIPAPLSSIASNGEIVVTYQDGADYSLEVNGTTYTTDVDGAALNRTNSLAGPQWVIAPVLVDDGTPDVGETLTITHGVCYQDGPVGDAAITWTTNAENAVDDSNPAAPTLTLASADQGVTITVTATATDDNGARSATSSGVYIPVAAVAPAFQSTDRSGGGSDQPTALIAGLSLGANFPGRHVLVAVVGWATSDTSAVQASLDGSLMTKVVGDQVGNYTGLYNLPSSLTTADVLIDFAGAGTLRRAAVATFTYAGYAAVASDTIDTPGGDFSPVDISVEAGDVIIVAAFAANTSSNTITWVGATEVAAQQLNGPDDRASFAMVTAASTGTETITPTATGAGATALSYVVLRAA